MDEGETAVLVTKDAALRIKGTQLAVEVQDYRADTVQVPFSEPESPRPRAAERPMHCGSHTRDQVQSFVPADAQSRAILERLTRE